MGLIQISEFTKKVLIQIKSIPEGHVATYKQIAELAGKPQGARGVAWILHSCSTIYKLPWHRVISSQGKISFEINSFNFRKQKRLLEKESITLSAEGKLNLKKFQWKKSSTLIRNKKNRPKIFSKDK